MNIQRGAKSLAAALAMAAVLNSTPAMTTDYQSKPAHAISYETTSGTAHKNYLDNLVAANQNTYDPKRYNELDAQMRYVADELKKDKKLEEAYGKLLKEHSDDNNRAVRSQLKLYFSETEGKVDGKDVVIWRIKGEKGTVTWTIPEEYRDDAWKSYLEHVNPAIEDIAKKANGGKLPAEW